MCSSVFKNDINSSSISFHFSSSKPLGKQENEAYIEIFTCNAKLSSKCLSPREIFQYHQNKSNKQKAFCRWELLLVLIFRIGFQITFKYTCLIKITKLIWLFYTHQPGRGFSKIMMKDHLSGRTTLKSPQTIHRRLTFLSKLFYI